MDNTDGTDDLRDFPQEEVARILHAKNVVLALRPYIKWKLTTELAMFLYGSSEVVSSFPQSLGDNYLRAYLSKPLENRNARDALIHAMHLDHNDAHTLAILIAKLDGELLEAAAAQFNVSTDLVQTALLIGIAELLNSKQLVLVELLSLSLTTGSSALRQLRSPKTRTQD